MKRDKKGIEVSMATRVRQTRILMWDLLGLWALLVILVQKEIWACSEIKERRAWMACLVFKVKRVSRDEKVVAGHPVMPDFLDRSDLQVNVAWMESRDMTDSQEKREFRDPRVSMVREGIQE